MTSRNPSPRELTNDPELAALAALDALLELSISALHAAYPDIGLDEPERHRLTACAGSIVEASHQLRGLLRAYRAALARHHRNIPF